MDEFSLTNLITMFMVSAALLAGVPLAVATVTGLIISFFQAVTQIQDQTLSQTIKIAAISIVLMSMTSWLTGPLMSATDNLFQNFAVIVQ